MGSAIFNMDWESLGDLKFLKLQFHCAFGGTLRIYTTPACKVLADDKLKVARLKGTKSARLNFTSRTLVSTFEREMAKAYGIGVQVANHDNSKLVPNDLPLGKSSMDPNWGGPTA